MATTLVSELAKLIRDRRLIEFMRIRAVSTMLHAVSVYMMGRRERWQSRVFDRVQKQIDNIQRDIMAEEERLGPRVFHNWEL